MALTKDLLSLNLPEATVTIRLDPGKVSRLQFQCSECNANCEHIGAAFSLILEEKLLLGLAAPPPERAPIESLGEEELINRALQERAQRAETEKMDLSSLDEGALWTDYILTSHASGKSYRVALRGWERGESYCSCPDYRNNTIGACKHIFFAIAKLKEKFGASVPQTPYQVKEAALYLRHGEKLELCGCCSRRSWTRRYRSFLAPSVTKRSKTFRSC